MCYNALIRYLCTTYSGTKSPGIQRKDDSINSILNQFSGKFNDTFSFFDRMIMKGFSNQVTNEHEQPVKEGLIDILPVADAWYV